MNMLFKLNFPIMIRVISANNAYIKNAMSLTFLNL